MMWMKSKLESLILESYILKTLKLEQNTLNHSSSLLYQNPIFSTDSVVGTDGLIKF